MKVQHLQNLNIHLMHLTAKYTLIVVYMFLQALLVVINRQRYGKISLIFAHYKMTKFTNLF